MCGRCEYSEQCVGDACVCFTHLEILFSLWYCRMYGLCLSELNVALFYFVLVIVNNLFNKLNFLPLLFG